MDSNLYMSKRLSHKPKVKGGFSFYNQKSNFSKQKKSAAAWESYQKTNVGQFSNPDLLFNQMPNMNNTPDAFNNRKVSSPNQHDLRSLCHTQTYALEAEVNNWVVKPG